MAQGGSFKKHSQMGQKTDQDKTLHVAKSCDLRQRVDANEDSISRRSAFVQYAGKAREIAFEDIRKRAAELGANAIVGVDIDYETVGETGGMLMVSVAGTAVRLDQ